MHIPTYSEYVPHTLSMSADSRTVPPVTRPLEREHPHPIAAPSPTHTGRPCYAGSMFRVCVVRMLQGNRTNRTERATKKYISYVELACASMEAEHFQDLKSARRPKSVVPVQL